MSAVTALVEALEAWDTRADLARCYAVERAAQVVGAEVGLSVSELLDAVGAARRGGAGIGQAVHAAVKGEVAA